MFNLKAVGTSISNGFFKTMYNLKEMSPELLTIAGVTAMGVSTFTACKSTLKLEKVTDANAKAIEDINERFAETGDEALYKKELRAAKGRAVLSYVKLYGPSAALFAAGAGSVFGGNRVLRKRCGALAAACTAIETSYENYRQRVREAEGEEADYKYLHGIKEEQVGTERKKNEKGKYIEEPIVEQYIDLQNRDAFTAFWGPGYSDQAMKGMNFYNQNFLEQLEKDLNRELSKYRVITLNHVLRRLGLEEKDYGLIYGWNIDSVDPSANRFISLGVRESSSEATERFRNGNEEIVLLKFNVDPQPLYGAHKRKPKQVNYVRVPFTID